MIFVRFPVMLIAGDSGLRFDGEVVGGGPE
jgi:hypothetical protein